MPETSNTHSVGYFRILEGILEYLWDLKKNAFNIVINFRMPF